MGILGTVPDGEYISNVTVIVPAHMELAIDSGLGRSKKAQSEVAWTVLSSGGKLWFHRCASVHSQHRVTPTVHCGKTKDFSVRQTWAWTLVLLRRCCFGKLFNLSEPCFLNLTAPFVTFYVLDWVTLRALRNDPTDCSGLGLCLSPWTGRCVLGFPSLYVPF